MKSKSLTTTRKAKPELLPLITPGEYLVEAFLEPLKLSINALAIALRVPATRMQAIVKGGAALRPTRLCASRNTSGRRPSSGSTCREISIWIRRSAKSLSRSRPRSSGDPRLRLLRHGKVRSAQPLNDAADGESFTRLAGSSRSPMLWARQA